MTRETTTRAQCLLAFAGAPALAALVAGCGAAGGGAPNTAPVIGIVFRDVAATEVFDFEGVFRVAPAGEGLWAAVPGLPQPERGLVGRPEGGSAVLVGLFPGAAPTLSTEVASRLGLDAAPARLRVVAVRSEVALIELPR